MCERLLMQCIDNLQLCQSIKMQSIKMNLCCLATLRLCDEYSMHVSFPIREKQGPMALAITRIKGNRLSSVGDCRKKAKLGAHELDLVSWRRKRMSSIYREGRSRITFLGLEARSRLMYQKNVQKVKFTGR